MDVFDGLPDIFTGVFGEPVVYTPAETEVSQTITAIWYEEPIDAVLGEEASADDVAVTLHLRAADVASPQEGDTAQRVSDGKIMRIVPPIRPDGKGMIVCALERTVDDA